MFTCSPFAYKRPQPDAIVSISHPFHSQSPSPPSPTHTMSFSILTEIKIDHDNIRDLLERYKSTSDVAEKTRLANTLIREATIHSDAEEVTLYTRLPEQLAQKDREEHSLVRKLLYELESNLSNVGQSSFDALVLRAVTTFLDHAQEEETVQLPDLLQKLSAQENNQLALDFMSARKQALSGGSSNLPGKFSLSGREFADLRLNHTIV